MIAWWLIAAALVPAGEWGFFGHRLINRSAVFTLPTAMIGWYKPHIDFIAEHAVDADKRRYATRHEAVRHYMDLDHWGTAPFDHVPRRWDEALAVNLEVFAVAEGDTLYLLRAIPPIAWTDSSGSIDKRLAVVRKGYRAVYYEDDPVLSADSLSIWLDEDIPGPGVWHVRDALTAHGILPYHLLSMQHRLTEAFRQSDLEQVLRVSADLGHYIGDACVPLHTTANYNGQMTDQIGIHAFWESRIPELYAEREFDFVVGGAEYIADPGTYFWSLVTDSHAEVERVLAVERELRARFPTDRQMCFEDRLDQHVLTQCEPFARAYHEAMDHMVEARFRTAIKALGDAWYTAWIDAGQPASPASPGAFSRSPQDEDLDKTARQGKSMGREHGQ